jgi:probable addiction module antidote protein
VNPKTAKELSLAPYDSAAYLQTVMAEANEDPAYLARACNMRRLARDTGLTGAGVRMALAPGGNPHYATVANIAKALGFRLTLMPVGKVESKSQDLTQ